MYVTGAITSADIDEDTAVLKGSATVTGAGAGSDQAFTATVERGGSGATLVLDVSGLTFREILLEGRFRFEPSVRETPKALSLTAYRELRSDSSQCRCIGNGIVRAGGRAPS